MITAMSETSPNIPDNSPLALARRVKGYIGALASLAQRFLHHHQDPADRTPRTQMELGRTQTLRTHIQRLEYQLRCYILWLAAQMLERGATEPGYLDTLPSYTSNPQAQPSRGTALSPFHVCEQQTETDKNTLSPFYVCAQQTRTTENALSPFPVCGTQTETTQNSIIHQQELELRRLTAKTPSIGGFQVIPAYPDTRSKHANRKRGFTRDPLLLVDARALLARLNRLPRILKRADGYAVKLVLSTVSDPPPAPPFQGGEQTARVAPPPLTKGRYPKGGGDQTFPLYIPPFIHWLPPDALWSSAEDETERADVNLLHYLASSALIRAGHGPPEETNSGLPHLTALDPLPPPQIRLLNHPRPLMGGRWCNSTGLSVRDSPPLQSRRLHPNASSPLSASRRNWMS